ncbi:MAG: hypothetical protein HY611_03610 [Elusimicrobia bacterium]|nr:hypothetical protein [Elusimicrobiota bacterium]
MRVVEALRGLGYSLSIEYGAFRYKCVHPCPPPQAAELLAEIKSRKAEVLAYLGIPWPAESCECEAKFGQGPAHLYPFINKTVATPLGAGTLWQVGDRRVGIVLAQNPSKVTFMPWFDVRPTGGNKT